MVKINQVFLCICLFPHVVRTKVSQLSVNCSALSAKACHVKWSIDTRVSAYASYDKSTNLTTGFATLEVRAGRIAYASEAEQLNAAFAAGFAEGMLTAEEIPYYQKNAYDAVFECYKWGDECSGPSADLKSFVQRNDAYVREKAADLSKYDDFWHEVSMVLARFDGLVAGYGKMAAERGLRPLSTSDLLWANLNDDLGDLQVKFGGMPRQLGHCSTLFRLTPGNQDLYFGHTTWDVFALAAPRIWKHLTLPVRRSHALYERTNSHTSSPGIITSLDDWFVVTESSQEMKLTGTRSPAASLVITPTTNFIYKKKLYDLVRESRVLYWIRVMVTNSLAMSAPQWAEIYSREASGTDNNQWQIADLLLFKPGESLKPNTFVVMEEVPGFIHYEDQSAKLEADRYWPSFNVAYYNQTRELAGEIDSFTEHPRAQLFRELQGNVTDDDSMKWVMGWNDYKHDPISKGDPSYAIAARSDLKHPPYAEGGYDSKMSSWRHVTHSRTAFGRAGPTHDELAPFCWLEGEKFARMTHEGHPHCFNYSWGTFAPQPNPDLASAGGAVMVV